jgi:hypothetical protein
MVTLRSLSLDCIVTEKKTHAPYRTCILHPPLQGTQNKLKHTVLISAHLRINIYTSNMSRGVVLVRRGILRFRRGILWDKDKRRSRRCSSNSLGLSVSGIRAGIVLRVASKTCSYLSMRRFYARMPSFPRGQGRGKDMTRTR